MVEVLSMVFLAASFVLLLVHTRPDKFVDSNKIK